MGCQKASRKLPLGALSKTKAVVSVLTFILWLAVWFVFDPGHIMSFWHSHYWDSTLLLTSALCLWLSRPWGYLVAALLAGRELYGMGGFLIWPSYEVGTADERGNIVWSGMLNWWKLTLEAHPQYIAHALLAAAILFISLIGVARWLIRKRPLLP